MAVKIQKIRSLPQPPVLMARLPVQPNIAGELARREGAVGIVVEADAKFAVVALDDQRRRLDEGRTSANRSRTSVC
jgi:hypothetical protein